MRTGSERVFVSYRREDAGVIAGRIYDRLSASLGARRIYMDVYANEPGDDFKTRMEAALQGATTCLPLIGPTWETVTLPGNPRPRLWDDDDLVRREIEMAFQANLNILPVLVDRTEPPKEADLPPTLRSLLDKHLTVLKSDETFDGRIRHIVNAVDRSVFEDAEEIRCVVLVLEPGASAGRHIDNLILRNTLNRAGVTQPIVIDCVDLERRATEIMDADLLVLLGSRISPPLGYLLGRRSALFRIRTLILHHAEASLEHAFGIESIACRVGAPSDVERACTDFALRLSRLFNR